jgi:hypothetical protein
LKDPPMLIMPFSFKQGEEWIFDTIDNADSRVPLKRSFQGMQKIDTKMGVFNCYKFEFSGFSNNKRYHYFCPDIGLVMKESVTDSFGLTDITTGDIIKYVTAIQRWTLFSTD